jgi:hypothetical protein
VEYAKVQNATLGSPAFLVATASCLGAWVRLNAYCAAQESGGVIPGSRPWTDRLWLGAANVDTQEVAAVVEANLARWDGDDLVLHGYDHTGESALRTKRAQGPHGQKGGRPPNNPKGLDKENPKGFGKRNPSGNPQSTQSTQSTHPVHELASASSPAPGGAARSRSDESPPEGEGRYALRKLLRRHRMPSGDKQCDEWAGLAVNDLHVRDHQEGLEIIDWLIVKAKREHGRGERKPAPQYADHVDDLVPLGLKELERIRQNQGAA